MRNLLRAAGLVSLFAVCLLMTSPDSSAAPGGDRWYCSVTCCGGTRAAGFGDTADEAYQNLSCEGGMCEGSTIECGQGNMQ